MAGMKTPDIPSSISIKSLIGNREIAPGREETALISVADLANLIYPEPSALSYAELDNRITDLNGEVNSNATAIASIITSVASAALVGGEAPLGADYTADPDGRVVSYVADDGAAQAASADGFGPIRPLPVDGATDVSDALVVGFETDLGGRYETDADGRLVEMVGANGAVYGAGPSGFGVSAKAHDAGGTSYVSDYTEASGSHFNQYPVAFINDDTVIYLVIIAGQSLGEGYNDTPTGGGDDAFSTTPPYPDNAFMPSFGSWLRGFPGVRYSAFAPLKESDPNVNVHETQATSLAQHLLYWLSQRTGSMPRVLLINASIGGSPWQQLMPGSQAWINMVNAVTDAVGVATGQGKRIICPCVVANYGESNYINYKTPSVTMREFMRNAQRALNRDIRKITGQSDDVVLMPWDIIISSGGQYSENGVFDAYSRLDDPSIRMISTHYALPMAGTTGQLHHNSMSYYRMGKIAAQAILSEVFGPGHTTTRLIRSYWLSTTKIRLDFAVPTAPLVIDTSGVDVHVPIAGTTPGWAGSKYGIEADDGLGNAIDLSGATIEVVTPADSGRATAIDITLTAAPAAKQVWLSYAWHPDSDNVTPGPLSGSRGCIRDSSAIESLVDGKVDHFWALPWRAPVGERLI